MKSLVLSIELGLTVGDPEGGLNTLVIISTATRVYSSLDGYRLYPNIFAATDDKKAHLASFVSLPETSSTSDRKLAGSGNGSGRADPTTLS